MMVSNLSLCLVGMALCQSTPMSEDITQQNIPYSQVDESHINDLLEDIITPSYSREIPHLDTFEYIEGYYDYVEEQERLEQEQIAEEQRKLEEQRRLEEEQQRELERIAWENRFDRKEYRQTVYSVTEGEVQLGSGLYYGHPSVRNINNVMHYNDAEYGWLPIYAININEVTASGQNSRGIWNIYGSIIEMRQGDKTWYAYVGDACGQCAKESKIDLWTYSVDLSLDTTGIDWRIVRYGY